MSGEFTYELETRPGLDGRSFLEAVEVPDVSFVDVVPSLEQPADEEVYPSITAHPDREGEADMGDTPSGDEGNVTPDKSVVRAWGEHQVPEVLSRISSFAAERGHDVVMFIPEEKVGLRSVAALLADTSLSNEELGVKMGTSAESVQRQRNHLASAVCRSLRNGSRLPVDMPTPQGAELQPPEIPARALIKDWLAQKGISMTRAAKTIGVAQPTVSRLVSGVTLPEFEAVAAKLLAASDASPALVEHIRDLYEEEHHYRTEERRLASEAAKKL